MPIGILGSLVVCTILYILVSLVLTGLVSYKTLNVSAPVALASTQRAWVGDLDAGEDRRGLRAGHGDAGHAAGPDARLLLDVERRPAAQVGSAIHPKFRTPWITTIVFGSFAAIMPALSANRRSLRSW
jgi:basic amino acid/polyamine antiporter, APA family